MLVFLSAFLLYSVIAHDVHTKKTCLKGQSKAADEQYHQSFGNVDYDEAKMNLTQESLPTRTRNQVLACAKDWADRKIPYCQCNGPTECMFLLAFLRSSFRSLRLP